jgi:hypothetical protein
MKCLFLINTAKGLHRFVSVPDLVADDKQAMRRVRYICTIIMFDGSHGNAKRESDKYVHCAMRILPQNRIYPTS